MTLDLSNSDDPCVKLPFASPCQGLYKCRVDFATAPTRISNIVLDVIVPPEKPRIHDENNQEVRLKLGPYKLGDTVTVTCEVSDLER